jgi:hypothetical protein
MQCLESLDFVCEDLHRIMSTHSTRILPKRICDTYRSRRSLQSLVTPVGPDMSAASPDRSHAVPLKPGICMKRPAQDNVNPCDNNIAKH